MKHSAFDKTIAEMNKLATTGNVFEDDQTILRSNQKLWNDQQNSSINEKEKLVCTSQITIEDHPGSYTMVAELVFRRLPQDADVKALELTDKASSLQLRSRIQYLESQLNMAQESISEYKEICESQEEDDIMD